jgi:hypothetical protein
MQPPTRGHITTAVIAEPASIEAHLVIENSDGSRPGTPCTSFYEVTKTLLH